MFIKKYTFFATMQYNCIVLFNLENQKRRILMPGNSITWASKGKVVISSEYAPKEREKF